MRWPECVVCSETERARYNRVPTAGELYSCSGCGLLTRVGALPPYEAPDQLERHTEIDAAHRYLAILQKSGCLGGKVLVIRGADAHPLESLLPEFGYAVRFHKMDPDAPGRGLSSLPDKFDAVVILFSVDRTAKANELLNVCRSVMHENSVLLLTTALVDTWVAKTLKQQWVFWNAPNRCYFSTPQLRILLGNCGFNNIVMSTDRRIYLLSNVLERLDANPKLGLQAVLRGIQRLVPEKYRNKLVRIPSSAKVVTARVGLVSRAASVEAHEIGTGHAVFRLDKSVSLDRQVSVAMQPLNAVGDHKKERVGAGR